MKFGARLFLLLIVTLRYPISKRDQEFGRLEKYLAQDVSLCPRCFTPKSEMCVDLNRSYDFLHNSITTYLNTFFSSKNVHYGYLGDNPNPVMAKYAGNKRIFNMIEQQIANATTYNETIKGLKRLFTDKTRIDGFQYCPKYTIADFLYKLRNHCGSFLEAWMHININVATILLPALNSHNFPVPKYYGHCGFTLYESYDGQTLYQLQEVQYTTKLRIAKKLLLAALKFTKGFNDYRIYLTDITLDNVVYNVQSEEVSFIDLDNVIIVDTMYNRSGLRTKLPHSRYDTIHKYQEIECKGCFAYAQGDLCNHRKSDINIYSICQLLHQDLHGDTSKGYLKPIPHVIEKNFDYMLTYLKICVSCPENCANRFHSAQRLIQIFTMLINRFNPKNIV